MKDWWKDFDERQQKQIDLSRIYAKDFHHGADGHNNMMIIAGMADKLDGVDDLVEAARKVLDWYHSDKSIYHTSTMTTLRCALEAYAGVEPTTEVEQA